MRRVDSEENVAALRAALAVRAAAGWSLHEGAERVAGLAPDALELRACAGGVTLAAPEAGRAWRVVGWEERGGELRLSVRGAFGRVSSIVRVARDGSGTFSPGERSGGRRSGPRGGRGSGGPAFEARAGALDWFEEAAHRAVAERFGEPRLTRRGPSLVGAARDARGRAATVVALAPEAADRADDMLAAGLVARDRAERASGRPRDLLVFSGPPASIALAERLAWLRPRAAVRLFDVSDAGASEVRPHDQGTLLDASRALWAPPEPSPSAPAARALALAPDALRMRRRAGDAVERITLRGLECARVRRRGGTHVASFGVGRERERLDCEAAWERFAALVDDLARLRAGDAPDRLHLAYRAEPERWLASLLADDVTHVDPALDPRRVYEQVPATRRDSRDLIDLLAVTRAGRLAVVEVKASEDRALPFQGLNYWTRVRWHHARGEFARRGYFPEVALDPRPPLLYLVAPLFRLHASVEVALGLFAPEVEAIVVGLNLDWRSGPRALRRWDARGADC